MKKFILRSFALATVVAGFVCHSANAQEAAAADSDALKFTPSMKVAMRYTLLDSTRKSNFDFLSQKLTLGGKISQGAFKAVGEANFRGNNYGEYAGGSQATGGQSVGVTKAYIAYDFYKNDANGNLGVTLGRFAPDMVTQYGNDAITGWFSLSGFFPEDGLMLTYTGKPGGVDLTAQFAVVNSMQLWLYSGATVGPKTWGFEMWGSGSALKGDTSFNGNGGATSDASNSSSNTAEKAYIAFVSANIEAGAGKVELAADYGMKNNAVQSPGTAAGVSADCTTTPGTCTAVVSAASGATSRDVQYYEASAGYNYQDNLKLGAWPASTFTYYWP